MLKSKYRNEYDRKNELGIGKDESDINSWKNSKLSSERETPQYRLKPSKMDDDEKYRQNYLSSQDFDIALNKNDDGMIHSRNIKDMMNLHKARNSKKSPDGKHSPISIEEFNRRALEFLKNDDLNGSNCLNASIIDEHEYDFSSDEDTDDTAKEHSIHQGHEKLKLMLNGEEIVENKRPKSRKIESCQEKILSEFAENPVLDIKNLKNSLMKKDKIYMQSQQLNNFIL